MNHDYANALKESQRTYLNQLRGKIKALYDEKDPAAANLIKAETDKVTADSDYFQGLMLKSKKD